MEPINRKLLKENGKIALKRNFWMIMVVAFLGGLLGANWTGLMNNGGAVKLPTSSFNGSSYRFNSSSNTGIEDIENIENVEDVTKQFLESLQMAINQNGKSNFTYNYDESLSESENVKEFFISFFNSLGISEEELVQSIGIGVGVILLIALLVYILSICFQFALGSFLYAPVGVGYRRYFMLNRKEESQLMDLFFSFKKGQYMKIVKSMFKTNIRIFGWSLLFYFPGLVKSYQYYFVPYIMAENPEISGERAREISTQMTDGHKWQMFVLGLSFLGWAMLFVLIEIILALVSCGLLAIPGALLIYPLVGYQQVTWAELYAERREYAIVSNIATNEELKGF